jgi:hypothetical protein
VSRKDSKVKICGQRVELGYIKYYLREYLPEATQVPVKIFSLAGGKDRVIVAAFSEVPNKICDTLERDIITCNDFLVKLVISTVLQDKLVKRMPRYIVRAVFIALPQLHLTTSSKTNRRRLRKISTSFSTQQLAKIRASGEHLKRVPSTKAERTMQQL